MNNIEVDFSLHVLLMDLSFSSIVSTGAHVSSGSSAPLACWNVSWHGLSTLSIPFLTVSFSGDDEKSSGNTSSSSESHSCANSRALNKTCHAMAIVCHNLIVTWVSAHSSLMEGQSLHVIEYTQRRNVRPQCMRPQRRLHQGVDRQHVRQLTR